MFKPAMRCDVTNAEGGKGVAVYIAWVFMMLIQKMVKLKKTHYLLNSECQQLDGVWTVSLFEKKKDV